MFNADTKEKPFSCQCGASFGRRDLLTRHQRVSGHDPGEGLPAATPVGIDTSQKPRQSQSEESGSNEAIHVATIAPDVQEVSRKNSQPLPETTLNQTAFMPPHEQPKNSLQTRYYEAASLPTPLPGINDVINPGDAVSSLDLSGIDPDMHFRDFASFLDGVGLCVDWSPILERLEEPLNATTIGELQRPTPSSVDVRTRAGSPFSSWLPSAPTKDRTTDNVCDISSGSCNSRISIVHRY